MALCLLVVNASANPTSPTVPSQTVSVKKNRIPDNPFKCDRLISYRGKTLPCDSPLARDGELLRPIMADVPESIEALDTYQRNRKQVRVAAYTGTLGLVVALTAPMTKGLFVPSGADREHDRDKAESTIRYAGFGIAIGSLLFGLNSLRANEDNLKTAVIRYNQAHPDKPIELLFHSEF